MSSTSSSKMYDLEWFTKHYAGRANLSGRRKADPGTFNTSATSASKTAVVAPIFELPLDFVPGIEEDAVQDLVAHTHVVVVPANIVPGASASATEQPAALRPLTCRACKCIFADVSEMRLHFRSEEHLATSRQAASTQKASKTSAGAGVGGKGGDDVDGDESDSGSSSSSSDDDAGDLNTIPEDNEVEAVSGDRTQEYEQGRVRWIFDNVEGTRVAFMRAGDAFEMSINECALSLPDATHWEDYKTLRIGGGSYDPWSALRYSLHRYRANPVWAVMAMRSGRFAAAVFDGSTPLAHKTFRRYTVRAKAGGSQSSYDSGGRKARSAGAMLRRYGEQALLEDIRSLMKSWEQLLQSCSLILLSIPKTLRPSVFDREKESVIDRNDPRVRYVSFMTDKPTFETLKEIHSKCAQVLIAEPSVISKPEVSVADNSIESESVPVRAKASKEVQKSTLSNEDAWISCPESVELFDILRQMQAAHGSKEASRTLMDALSRCLSTIQMVYRDDVSDLKEVNTDDIDDDGFTPMTPATLNREMSLDLSVSEVINLPDSLQSISTALHLAADMGDEKVITQLLRMGADPTKRDVRGRAPYILCKTKEARDAFRRFRACCESRYDWTGAGVPEALTAEAEAAQREKEKEKKKRAKQKKAEAATQQQQHTSVVSSVTKDGKVSASSIMASSAASKPKKEDSKCASCGAVLNKRTSVDVLDKQVCGAECAAKLRRRIQAEAAEARLKAGSASSVTLPK